MTNLIQQAGSGGRGLFFHPVRGECVEIVKKLGERLEGSVDGGKNTENNTRPTRAGRGRNC